MFEKRVVQANKLVLKDHFFATSGETDKWVVKMSKFVPRYLRSNKKNIGEKVSSYISKKDCM